VSSLAPEPEMALVESARTLAPLAAEARILWALERFADRVVLLSSMQRTGIVLMHMFHALDLPNQILFIDTGYHFFETLRMRDQTMRQWRLNLVTLYPENTTEEQEARFGKKLFSCVDGQAECCRLRKEAPLLRFLATKHKPVLVNGLRQAEGGMRKHLDVLSLDPRTGGFQLSPLYDWTTEAVDSYIARHNLPVHPLYAKCFASIGCYPCTTPIRPGEDARAGRWRHLRQAEEEMPSRYCGVNFSDGSGI
jgi:phosphoadenosine phosphosulfate reductase